MGKWVNIRLEIEAAVPLEALSSVAPGIDVEEFQELLNNDPDEAIEMLKGSCSQGRSWTMEWFLTSTAWR